MGVIIRMLTVGGPIRGRYPFGSTAYVGASLDNDVRLAIHLTLLSLPY
jgi:hypothetical protein